MERLLHNKNVPNLGKSVQDIAALPLYTSCIRSDRTLARYRHLEGMDVAVLAANVLDERAAAQEAEVALAPFMQKDWSVDQRAKFVKAVQAVADATAQPLVEAAQLVVHQMNAGKKKTRKRSS